MKWIKPEYSKEKVKKAGKSLVHAEIQSKEFDDAIPIFFNWRSAHAFPMQIMLSLLRLHAKKIDKKALVVQRMKREQSILLKLYREKYMSLNRMEDIAGCRVVVNDVGMVTEVYSSMNYPAASYGVSN
jgi:ppGpp synthetase/RelA/SpoT-type nucleotidyltranferase